MLAKLMSIVAALSVIIEINIILIKKQKSYCWSSVKEIINKMQLASRFLIIISLTIAITDYFGNVQDGYSVLRIVSPFIFLPLFYIIGMSGKIVYTTREKSKILCTTFRRYNALLIALALILSFVVIRSLL